MLEILSFIFSSPWTWLGSFALLWSVMAGIGLIIAKARGF